MKDYSILKLISAVAYALILCVMAAATVYGKILGDEFAFANIYNSWWFAALWAILVCMGVSYLLYKRLFRRPLVFILHLSFVIIITGFLFSRLSREYGEVHLTLGERCHSYVDRSDSTEHQLPFSILLTRFDSELYLGTNTPMDYTSHLRFSVGSRKADKAVSINNSVDFNGYSFYMVAFDEDKLGVTLSVYHDPWGTSVSFAGYALLFICMILLVCLPNSKFVKAMRKLSSSGSNNKGMLLGCLLFLFLFSTAPAAEAQSPLQRLPKTLPQEYAKRFGDLYAYYNGRICPLQTVAIDFTLKLYGSSTYRDFSAEQVLMGWMIYPTDWMGEKMIKVRRPVSKLVGSHEKYLSFNDLLTHKAYVLHPIMTDIRAGKDIEGARSFEEADEKINLLRVLLSGQLVKLFPYIDEDASIGRQLKWYCAEDKLPSSMSIEKWTYIRNAMNLVSEMSYGHNYRKLGYTIDKLKEYQRQTVGEELPSDASFKAEKLYSTLSMTLPISFILICLSILSFIVVMTRWATDKHIFRNINAAFCVMMMIITVYLFFIFALRWIASGRMPITNGFETMHFMAMSVLCIVLLFGRRSTFSFTYGFMIAGICTLVSVLGENNPQITNPAPILSSPILSIHVCSMMIAYALFALTFANAIGAFIMPKHSEGLTLSSEALLYPALAFLTIGIFVGAIYADHAWGCYWHWDPKEVWSLITLMVYAVPLHIKHEVKKTQWYHIYMGCAFIVVLITYYGVNYFLGGIHAEAFG